MSLIGDARDRAKAFARRKAGILKKVRELAKLRRRRRARLRRPRRRRTVRVGVEPGRRHRHRLPADKRAKHTHLGYLNCQLGKEEGRLDKKRRQGLNAFACPGEAMLRDMNLEELLASIDAALLASGGA